MATQTPNPQLSDEQMQLLASVLDAIIPKSESRGLPGAGEVGLGDILCEKAAAFIPVLAPGLDLLREKMENREVADFASGTDTEKRSLLEAVAAEQPVFLPGLLFQVYSNYYQHPRVLEALGLDARPPYPLGHDVEPGDMSLLDPVRRKAPLYRDGP